MRLRRDLLDGAKALLRPGMSFGDRMFGILGALWLLGILAAIPAAATVIALSLIRGNIRAAVVWTGPAIAAWFVARATLFE